MRFVFALFLAVVVISIGIPTNPGLVCYGGAPQADLETLKSCSKGETKSQGLRKRGIDTKSSVQSNVPKTKTSLPPADPSFSWDPSSFFSIPDSYSPEESMRGSLASLNLKNLHPSENIASTSSGRSQRANDVAALHKNDMKVVSDFRNQMTPLLTKLLRSAEIGTNGLNAFATNHIEVETELAELSADFAHMTSAGNLFRAEVAESFDKARSLFELLQYHAALTLRYGNQLEPGDGPQLVEKFGLELVSLEISMFSFFGGDGSIDTEAVNFKTRLGSAETWFELLMEKYSKMTADRVPYVGSFEKEIEKLIGVFHSLSQAVDTASALDTTEISRKGTRMNTPEVRELSKARTESLLSQLEETYKTMEDLMTQFYQTRALNVEVYTQAKDSVEQIAEIFKESSTPVELTSYVQGTLEKVLSKVFCMENVVACVLNQHCDARSQGLCSSQSFEKYSKLVSELEHSSENLLLSISNSEITNPSTVSQSYKNIEDHELRLHEIQSAVTTQWTTLPDFNFLKAQLQQVKENIENAETILRNDFGETSGATVFPQNETDADCNGILAEPFRLQFQDIESVLHGYLDPKGGTIDDLKSQFELQKTLFDEVRREAASKGLLCSAETITQVEKISNLFVLVESIFQPTQRD